jgi:hypothetical protein
VRILFARILESTKNGQILFARILASTKLVKSYLLEFQQGRKVKILFARILASTKNGQFLFDRILARKKGENPVCKNSSKYEKWSNPIC